MISSTCPHCQGSIASARFSARDFDSGSRAFDVVACGTCGLLHTSPFLTGPDLAAYYDSTYYGQGQGKFLPRLESLLRAMARRRARRLLQRLPAHAGEVTRVLDVGCGRAVLLEAMAGLGAECHGLEREGFDAAGVDAGVSMHLGTVDSLPFGPGSFQLVILWHVLEHLEKPGDVLLQLAELLAPGGLLAVAVPNIDSLQARWFGADWFHLDLPRHLWHFSPRSLERLWLAAGLEKVDASCFSAEQNLFGFIQSLLNRLLPGTPNRLYRAMQGDTHYSLPVWLIAAACVAPFALLESVLAIATGRGATYTVYLRKPG